MKKWLLLILAPFLLLTNTAFAVDLPDAPQNGIYDPQHYLDNSVSEHLENTNKDNNTQIGVYIVDSLDKSIEETSLEVARHWKIGDSKSNRGVLITIAVKDRKLRIETSNEVSGELTDIKAKEIIENAKPELRSNDYSGAVKKMITEVNNIAEHKSDNNTENTINSLVFWMFVVLILCAIVAIIKTLLDNNRNNDSGGGSGSSDDGFFTGLLLGSSLGSSSSSSSGSSWSGSDSWSAGNSWSGGDFDGGGSSGSW